MNGVDDQDVELLAGRLRREGRTWPVSKLGVVQDVLRGLGQLGYYAIRRGYDPDLGRRLVPVWMDDEIYLELLGGSTPIRSMRMEQAADGSFVVILQAAS